MVFSNNTDNFFDSLKDKYNFKLKHVGEPTYHLGGVLYRDPGGTLAWGACSYINKMSTGYEIMDGCNPSEYYSPMTENEHPDLVLSEEFD
jgi:hypothetical protein